MDNSDANLRYAGEIERKLDNFIQEQKSKMNIKETAVEIHQNNINKGFVIPGQKRNVGEVLILVVSEISEALEADRSGIHTTPEQRIIVDRAMNPEEENMLFKDYIKNSFEDEIADAVIRLFDISEEFGFDLEWHVRKKMNYNARRPFKHGKAY